MFRPSYGRSMKRTLSVLILLAAVVVAPAAASAASPGIISITAPSTVTLDSAGTPQNSAVLHSVYRSGYDGGALNLVVREWNTARRTLHGFFPSWGQPCEPDPSYRCVTRVRLRDVPKVDGAALRKGRLYVVEAWFESFAGGGTYYNPFDPGIRYAAFWTL